MAHEGKRAAYGGSYLEDVDWWKKPRETSRIGELKVMIPEILLLKAVWEHNRPLWFRTYLFHLGLYLVVGFLALLGLGAVLQLVGLGGTGLMGLVATLTRLVGPIGFVLSILGAVGLVFHRLSDSDLRKYSTNEHYLNLILFIVTMGVALMTWLGVDTHFAMAREFVIGLLTFSMAPVNPLFGLEVVLSFLLLAYIPLTHMSHFFMKYFLYHDIRWGDEPNVDNPATQAKIGVVLNYPVSWAAEHIAGDGKKTWAEVATHNPAAEAAGHKEQ